MKGLSSKKIRSGRQACSFVLITVLLLTLSCHCYSISYAMPAKAQELQFTENGSLSKSIFVSSRDTVMSINSISISTKDLSQVESITYDIPSSFVNPMTGNMAKYQGGKTIERSSKITYGPAGIINDLASPDYDGFMKLDDRYLIAVGSRFNTQPGQYIDLVLENGVVIKCIMGDAKADCDTDLTNTFTYKSRCCSEFIIDEKTIREDIRKRGNASLKYFTWDSPVVNIIVYDAYYGPSMYCLD